MLLIAGPSPRGARTGAQHTPGAFGRGVGVTRRRVSCKENGVDNRLSTGYDDPEVDLMDVPDLFGEEETVERVTRVPSERRSPRQTTSTPAVKDRTVKLALRPEMGQALALAASRGDTITSGSEGFSGDGVHTPTSLHYDGLAVDVRYAAGRARQVADYGAGGYTVLQEATHLHVSFDPRGLRA